MFAEITVLDDQERQVNLTLDYDEESNPGEVELRIKGESFWLDSDALAILEAATHRIGGLMLDFSKS